MTRQLFLDLGGELFLAEVAAPPPGPHEVRVRARASIVSSGTERDLVSFGRAGWLEKLRSEPERARQLLEKARADGMLAAAEAVAARLSAPIALGYASCGVIEAVGSEVDGLTPGDLIACNGPHAETALVPALLCARLAPETDPERAAFATLGAVALHALRQARLGLGERVAVLGLGLIGQLAAQLAALQGARVLGVDPIAHRRALAARLGPSTTQVVAPSGALKARDEADAVLVCAGSDALAQAAQLARAGSRIVLVGAGPIRLDRRPLYEKGLTLYVSGSYGPGRYDRDYEERGRDLDPRRVRWSAGRNIAEVAALIERGALQTTPLIEARRPLARAAELYDLLAQTPGPIAGAISYESAQEERSGPRAALRATPRAGAPPSPGLLGVVGAGVYAARTFLPRLKTAGAPPLVAVASRRGQSAGLIARRFEAERVEPDLDAILRDRAVGTIAVLTRHDSHAELALKALDARRNVFVEKPLALNEGSIERVIRARRDADRVLCVGTNRRFAPMAIAVGRALRERGRPATILITVHAGLLPADHWLRDEDQGGRLVGEGCHFIDLARYLAGRPIERGSASRLDRGGGSTLRLEFAGGSRAEIVYDTEGPRSLPKERIEVFSAGAGARMTAWRSLEVWNWPGLRPKRALRADKGHTALMRAFFAACRGTSPAPIPYDEIEEVARWSVRWAREAGRR